MTRVLVFGRGPGSGNPATVVSGPAGADAMQSIAAENATPATAFLLEGEPRRVRFFTPHAELPMCGHGSLAAGAVEARRRGTDRVTFLAGEREVVVDCSEPGVATLVMRGPGSAHVEDEPAPLFDALRVQPSDVLGSVHVASVGSPKWLVEMRDAASLRALQPDLPALAELSAARRVNGVYAFTRDTASSSVDALARAFNPLAGVDEDAATGVAAAALAWLWRERLQGSWLVVDQGIGLRDLNRLRARVDGDEIRVGGNVEILEENE